MSAEQLIMRLAGDGFALWMAFLAFGSVCRFFAVVRNRDFRLIGKTAMMIALFSAGAMGAAWLTALISRGCP